ncbi:YeeE/YedE family protein [Yersinia vastinensis]|uniref:YeeE/YedE family protein n=1 Tax=Yersinia vastinensis TaxID=2890318 RepID=UPI0005E13997|nr:YeeE/YedE family protein [Yersinia vastinensis]CNK84330.1 gene II and x proteins [Yersinia frederiksenii]
MNLLFSLVSGLIFGLGLIIAGMANPAKVLGFLDIGGLWDPSLALVMAAAVGVATIGFTWAKKRQTSLLGQPLQLPTATHIDRRLISGSLLFGIGWGLAGICPGPALVLVGAGMFKGIIFVAAMLAGMGIFSAIERYRRYR